MFLKNCQQIVNKSFSVEVSKQHHHVIRDSNYVLEMHIVILAYSAKRRKKIITKRHFALKLLVLCVYYINCTRISICNL